MSEINTGAMTAWEKSQFMLFVDITEPGSGQESWARIGKSTIFDLKFNPQIETWDFIEDENPTDLIKNYKPSIPQELYTLEGDRAFDALYEFMYELPIGASAMREVLLVFPKKRGGSFEAWKTSATLALSSLNTVDQKISFDVNLAGTIDRGTVTVSGGQPSFVPA